MIVGADVYSLILNVGVRKGTANEPVAQDTTLGWILSGPVPAISEHSNPSSNTSMHHCATLESVDSAIRRFWEVEELPSRFQLTPAETVCENHFVATHKRTASGRYCVRLSFVQGPPIDIGTSFPAVECMWLRQERRIHANPSLAAEYVQFMQEYESLQHMSEISDTDSTSSQHVYIPHHAVVRDNSITSRLRVVFNASYRTSNGTSLNDHLHIGRKLQTDLPAIILRWRLHRYVYIADIEKMYRQILVDDRDLDYQRIVWRASPTEPLRHFRLRTVTYGTAPAPYLALRVLQQLAADEGSKYPLALPVLQSQVYVDDCVFGADDQQLAIQTRNQLISLFKCGGFNLRKWASNSPALLADLNSSDNLAHSKLLQPDESLKVLGILWDPTSDAFYFNIQPEPNIPQTKRAILSTIAKFFDQPGWVIPVIVVAKIFMQKLWRLKCNWDVYIPSEIYDEWSVYY
ncbi:uncharacterized protein LOC105663908 [Megachile rotundata]|uniref:uncharacterized protein LOC105663908 n=1 Tax=Megachile rotundata TaxID=143995 RepID=UPI003FD2CB0F